MIGTFAGVLIFTMLKEAYEDYQRYKSDRELNMRKTRVFDSKVGSVQTCAWSHLKVGDIVRVDKNEEIPADLLLLSAPSDVVFVSTMNLDGETNLKDRELSCTNMIEEDPSTKLS
jgi:P-type E1-E2 ATPase